MEQSENSRLCRFFFPYALFFSSQAVHFTSVQSFFFFFNYYFYRFCSKWRQKDRSSVIRLNSSSSFIQCSIFFSRLFSKKGYTLWCARTQTHTQTHTHTHAPTHMQSHLHPLLKFSGCGLGLVRFNLIKLHDRVLKAYVSFWPVKLFRRTQRQGGMHTHKTLITIRRTTPYTHLQIHELTGLLGQWHYMT